MGVTYTHGRDLQHRRRWQTTIARGEILLALTSFVVVLAIGLTYSGRIRAAAWATRDTPAPVNLNAVATREALDAPVANVFPAPVDRRRVATAIFEALRANGDRVALANVGALARLRAPDGAPVMTAAELSSLKPFVSVRTIDDVRSTAGWCVLAMIVAFHAVSLVWRWRGVRGDHLLLALAHLLVGLGFVVLLSRPDPLRDTMLVVRYTEGVVVGLALFAIVSLIDIDRAAFRELSYLPLFGALALSVLLLVFGSGPGSSSAKVNLGPVQPIEAIRLLLALFLAGYFARRWELLRQARTLPYLDHVLPVVAGVAAALLLFFFQKDLGPALLLTLMFLSLFAIARGGVWLASAGLVGLVAGVAAGQWLNVSSTLAARLEMWRAPWDNTVRGGDQVAQALWGLGAGAIAGTGAGLGHTRFVPEGHTDLVLGAIGEEFGFIGLLVVGAAFTLLVWRGLAIARRASSDYRYFLAMALTLALAVPALVMAGGMLGLLPLTGVVTPFVSYGGSAMAANFAALGLLCAIGNERRAAADLAPFALPTRWLVRGAAAVAIALVAIAADVQVLRADDYLVRPQLSVQADGGRRFQYNPRVLDALADVPRGTIGDRRDAPLAANDCPPPGTRCYPGGDPFFHILGDTNTRTNWSAANSSYVERDAEALLRGFDDRATTVATTDRGGARSLAVRRDYSAIVPLVRHRYAPEHPDVKAFLTRPRHVKLTIDARLQQAAAAILARAAKTSGAGRGAVVVIDAATGELLASVSYPWPGAEAATESLLDRARYGLYPPGSTFKIVTAAAALREHSSFAQQEFLCQRLPSNRIGFRIPGFGPPIHDDVKDTHPHGSIAMHDAVAKSCNAYFAQLAVAVGSEALTKTAAAAGISLNTSRAADRVRANLPHAGYGQGEVLLTPLRLARVSAAIASDGTIREAPITVGGKTIATPFVTPDAARMLARDLRAAVTAGTGRLLAGHAVPIAGKTGTAEVDEEAPHAWFTGFAPYGGAAGSRRIAFAVLLEHAGYGGAAAANVAGQIVNAAASLGLTK